MGAGQARTQLELGLQRGIEIPHRPSSIPTADRALRQSSVLVLFGELDRVLAAESLETQAPGTQIPAELDVLLLRRSNGLRNHAGQIAFPGGGVEPGDADRVATALREANEETGLDPEGVDVLGLLPEFHIPVSNYMVTPVLGWWRRPSDIAADETESVEVFRVPVAELLNPAARGTSKLMQHGGLIFGPAFRLGPQFGGHIVWGFTAMLLSAIFDSVGWSRPWDAKQYFEVSRVEGANS